MMTCKDVSTLVSTGTLSDAPMARRLAVRLHLAMCRHCRSFRQQVAAVARGARNAAAAHAAEPSPEFESAIPDRLRKQVR